MGRGSPAWTGTSVPDTGSPIVTGRIGVVVDEDVVVDAVVVVTEAIADAVDGAGYVDEALDAFRGMSRRSRLCPRCPHAIMAISACLAHVPFTMTTASPPGNSAASGRWEKPGRPACTEGSGRLIGLRKLPLPPSHSIRASARCPVDGWRMGGGGEWVRVSPNEPTVQWGDRPINAECPEALIVVRRTIHGPGIPAGVIGAGDRSGASSDEEGIENKRRSADPAETWGASDALMQFGFYHPALACSGGMFRADGRKRFVLFSFADAVRRRPFAAESSGLVGRESATTREVTFAGQPER